MNHAVNPCLESAGIDRKEAIMVAVAGRLLVSGRALLAKPVVAAIMILV